MNITHKGCHEEKNQFKVDGPFDPHFGEIAKRPFFSRPFPLFPECLATSLFYKKENKQNMK